MNPTDATEQLLQCCPDDRSPSDAGVYALEIDVPDAGKEQLQRDWLLHFKTLPPYFHRLVDCDRWIYVGEAGDVQSRLDDHINSDKRQAALPSVFGVLSVIDVWWHDSKQDAEEAEYNRASSIDKATEPTTYVHSR